jgi:hypothetical protein
VLGLLLGVEAGQEGAEANWNWSSVELRANSGASWTRGGELARGQGGEEGPHAAHELLAGLRGGAGPGDLQGDEPHDVVSRAETVPTTAWTENPAGRRMS